MFLCVPSPPPSWPSPTFSSLPLPSPPFHSLWSHEFTQKIISGDSCYPLILSHIISFHVHFSSIYFDQCCLVDFILYFVPGFLVTFIVYHRTNKKYVHLIFLFVCFSFVWYLIFSYATTCTLFKYYFSNQYNFSCKIKE